jgi:peptide/nickel transport system substrate-binding protein
MRKSRNGTVAAVMLLGMALVLSAFAAEPASARTLKVRLYSGMATTDPFRETSAPGFQLLRHVYEGLFALDANLEPQPLLAESWKFSEDGKTLDIKLREGVIFHNGKTMTAADVVYSLNYYRANAANKAFLASIDSVTATDGLKVSIKLKAPSGAFIADLANPLTIPIVPEGSADNRGLVAHPVGTGPYYIESFDPQVRAVLKRFDKYVSPKGPPSALAGKREAILETLEWLYVAEDRVAAAGLETGDFDVITRVPPQDAKRLAGVPGVKILSQPGSAWVAASMNVSKGPLADVNVRRALTHAVDPDAMLDIVAFGAGRNVRSYSPPEVPWYRKGKTDYWPWQYDVKLAKQALAKSGYKGKPIEIMVGGPAYQEQNAVLLQQQAKQAGLNIVVNKLEHTTYLARGIAGQYEMRSEGGPFAATPDLFYGQFYCGNGPLRFGYCNRQYDALFEEASAELDNKTRNDKFAELEVMLKDDAVVLPFYLNNFILGARDNVKGLVLNPYEWLVLWNVSIE